MDSGKELLTKQKDNLEKGKKGLLSIVFGRTGILLILLLLQIGFLLACFQFLRDYLFAAYWGAELLGLVMVVYIINRPGNSAFKIAWIVPVLTLPVFGALFYIFFYGQIETKALNKRILEENAATASLVEQKEEVLKELGEDSVQMENMARYLRKNGGGAIHQNTSAKYYESGEAVFDTILEELKNAKKYIFIEFFIVSPGYMWDTVLEILKEKAREGVEVRLLYDGMCEVFRLPKSYPKELKEYGIDCRVFSPIMPALSTIQNNRDHRKILVIDGHTAFTGGINLADEYINKKERFGYWKDAAVMFKGEAVRSFTIMFLRMWTVIEKKKTVPEYGKYLDASIPLPVEHASGYVIPYGDNPLDTEQVAEMVYMDILNTAKRYVHIMTPYLVLDNEVKTALTYAAKRGVEVCIMMPHIPDKKYAFTLARSYYNELLDAGVKIYEFMPGFVHSKLFVSDDEKAVVGSINLDFRSMYLSFECAAVLYKNSAVAEIEQDFQKTLEQCMTVTKDVYNKQPLRTKLFGKLMKIFAPMM